MVVGTCKISLRIGDNHTLKGKRSVVRPLLLRLRQEFNVSAAETGAQDAWQSAEIGLAAVSGDAAYVDGLLQKAVAWIERHWLDVEVVDYAIEIVHV
jgi:uncharacterized protein YlxP (DUF503 family)